MANTNINIRMDADLTVSYTHLDVYKRQGIKRGSRSCSSPIWQTMILSLIHI